MFAATAIKTDQEYIGSGELSRKSSGTGTTGLRDLTACNHLLKLIACSFRSSGRSTIP
jgi:hypothetical protein